jgi:leucyl/phenylalanyl-tRNA--protein transferase
MIPWLDAHTPFPPLHAALRRPNGLLAAGGTLAPERLLAAYREGIFPWFSEGDPILWWSPDPRMVLFPDELKVSRSLSKAVRNRPHEIRFDSAFAETLSRCTEPREGQDGTWITDGMRAAYEELHRMGYAHSVEVWLEGELVGGLYGVALGRVFFGESMFSRVRDASKIALVALVRQLQAEDFRLIDCQMHTAHLASLGAREIPRREFSGLLQDLVHYSRATGPWLNPGSDSAFAHEPCRS